MDNRMKSILNKQFRSITAAVCALAMIFSMVPVAHATEHSHAGDVLVTEATEATVVQTTATISTEPAPSETVLSETISVETVPSEPAPNESVPTESEAQTGESELLIYLRGEVAAYIDTYGLTPDMPDSALANVFFSLDGERAYAAWS